MLGADGAMLPFYRFSMLTDWLRQVYIIESMSGGAAYGTSQRR